MKLSPVSTYISPSRTVVSGGIHPRIADAVTDMLYSSYLPYYAEFIQSVNFVESRVGTCGVSVGERGINFYWDRVYIESSSHQQIIFTIVHEVMHLILGHHSRGLGMNMGVANLAADMVINSIIHGELMVGENLGDQSYTPGVTCKNMISVPVDDEGNNAVVFLPVDYNGDEFFEDVYDWLLGRYDLWVAGRLTGTGYGYNGKSYTGSIMNPVKMYDICDFFANMQSNNGLTFDCHPDDEVPPDVREAHVGVVIDRLRNKSESGEYASAILHKLRKPARDYLSHVKRQLDSRITGRLSTKTITRPSRRVPGMKGRKKEGANINIILDTSMSMSSDIEKVLSCVYSRDVVSTVIQCDTDVRSVTIVRKMSELQKLEVKGLGGTRLMPAINHITGDAKLRSRNTVVLTDGHTDVLDFSGMTGNVLVVSTSKECDVKGSNKVKQIVIK